MKKFLIASLAVGFLLTACKKNKTSEVDQPSATAMSTTQTDLQYSLQWTGFKTPEKVGVKGTFDQIKLDNLNDSGASDEDQLSGATFTILTSSVNSGDKVRDTNIDKFLFKNMTGENISGGFGKFEADQVPVKITMNNITKEIPFNYSKVGDTLVVKGTIDIVKDFSASTALSAFAEACNVMHKGKTWSDVNIVAKFYK